MNDNRVYAHKNGHAILADAWELWGPSQDPVKVDHTPGQVSPQCFPKTLIASIDKNFKDFYFPLLMQAEYLLIPRADTHII